MPSIKEVDRRIRENDPPIEPNQIWEAKVKGETIRRVRILAQHPEPTPFAQSGRAWIYEEMAGGRIRSEIGRLGVFPEFNLRMICKLSRRTVTG